MAQEALEDLYDGSLAESADGAEAIWEIIAMAVVVPIYIVILLIRILFRKRPQGRHRARS